MSLQWKRTPLIWAVTKGHLTVVEALLKAGADVNAADEARVFMGGEALIFYWELNEKKAIYSFLLRLTS